MEFSLLFSLSRCRILLRDRELHCAHIDKGACWASAPAHFTRLHPVFVQGLSAPCLTLCASMLRNTAWSARSSHYFIYPMAYKACCCLNETRTSAPVQINTKLKPVMATRLAYCFSLSCKFNTIIVDIITSMEVTGQHSHIVPF